MEVADFPATELEKILTDEEKNLVENGADVSLTVQVRDATDSLTDEQKAALDDAVKKSGITGLTLGKFLDMDLYKAVTVKDALGIPHTTYTQLEEVSQKLQIAIKLPDELINHDDKFSIYSIAYADILKVTDNAGTTPGTNTGSDTASNAGTNTDNSKAGSSNSSGNTTVTTSPATAPKTQDPAPSMWMWFALFAISAGMITVSVVDMKRRMKEDQEMD